LWKIAARILSWSVHRLKFDSTLLMITRHLADFYNRRVLPPMLDRVCSLDALHEQRARIVPLASGRVLEVGIGTGLNLPHYDPAKIEKLWGLDPAVELQPRARARAEQAGLAIEIVGLSGEQIPFDDKSFDTAVLTYTLCSIPNPAQALDEMYRVLKPGGQLLFCEHGLAPEAWIRRWQERLTPLWRVVAGGCHLNRDPTGLIEAGGFSLRQVDALYLNGLKPLTFNYRGIAVRASAS